GSESSTESFCDGQFIVLPKVVLCFATLGETQGASHLPCPSCFSWRPRHLGYEPSDEFPWLPKKVREVWDRSQKQATKLRDHHIFLRIPTDERFFYAGRAHLGSYGNINGTGESANFSLKEKLPQDVWLKFGGYPGWLVEVNHLRHRVAAEDLT